VYLSGIEPAHLSSYRVESNHPDPLRVCPGVTERAANTTGTKLVDPTGIEPASVTVQAWCRPIATSGPNLERDIGLGTDLLRLAASGTTSIPIPHGAP
jgi:hypothetical protein